ncbi:MAG: hypothetical protein A3A47_04845 [Candidatus Levybacteria bacterium RIFCSPLOWO2_01_FULL_37_20]|nr:MAG: hypothetical protein A2770_01155 [Candidatus Levybacteria bacterium RIFCSPHIGHO2_01_FULL_38_12]OGH34020.1 MAG: hypothetical protein A3A47_04845 [Candidatus Levybacteria bacterium RIFCSPLOWO2_01_FULL_37_20]OGH44828.1 MAG: hypothetical protein A3J14_05380 [Candidatus Levybacteria bacterium RIFCSPLOWO2_02_FULL_37_18]
MKKQFLNFLPLFVLIILIIVFFFRLFYPHLSVFVTPDYGESDLLDGHYPLRFLFYSSLKENGIGLWTRLAGNGYPMFAQGEMGSLFLPNLILFKFLPFFWAINLVFILAFFTAGIGTYLFAKENGLKKYPALFSSVIFTFSGFLIAHISHPSVIQSASLLPLELYTVERFLKKLTFKNGLIVSLIISQQMFVGHQEITTYSLITIFLYVFVRSWTNKIPLKTFFNITIGLMLTIACSIFLSAATLLPSYELFDQTQGTGINLGRFPYLLKHLLMFVFPFFLGSPQNGTYPGPIEIEGIFWENTGYVGLLPIILLICSLFFTKQKHVKLFLLLTFSTLILALGRYSPFSFMYTIPPLAYFRVPNRFLMSVDVSLALLSGFMITQLFKKLSLKQDTQMIIICILICLQFVNISYYFLFYHPVGPVSKWMDQPKTVSFLKNESEKHRIYTLDDFEGWNNIFLKEGWKHKDAFIPFMASLPVYSNLLYDIPKSNYNFKFIPVRVRFLHTLIEQNFFDSASNTFSLHALKLFGMNNVKFITAPDNIKINNLTDFTKIQNYVIYKNPYFKNRARFASSYKMFEDIEDIKEYIQTEDYDPEKEELIESSSALRQSNICTACKNVIEWINDKDQKIELKTFSDANQILVLADTYYPGWKAYVDNKETKIFPANIVQRAIIVPKGKHIITFLYDPDSFRWGSIVSLFGYGLVLFLLFKPLFNIFYRLINVIGK